MCTYARTVMTEMQTIIDLFTLRSPGLSIYSLSHLLLLLLFWLISQKYISWHHDMVTNHTSIMWQLRISKEYMVAEILAKNWDRIQHLIVIDDWFELLFCNLFFQVRSIGPKLVRFFETITVYFALFGLKNGPESPLCCIVKCLPIISLMFFVLLHDNSFSKYYSYSCKVLAGLVFACIGDAFLVWRTAGYFIPGIVAFAVGQVHCRLHILYS